MGRNLKQSFGEMLRTYRLAAGLTQEELADLSGLSPRTLGGIEQDRVTRPYRNSVQQLADALFAGQGARVYAAGHPADQLSGGEVG